MKSDVPSGASAWIRVTAAANRARGTSLSGSDPTKIKEAVMAMVTRW